MKREDLILTARVKKALKTDERIEDISGSDGFWYNITIGGYVRIKDLLADKEQIAKAEEALETLKALEEIYEEVSLEM